MKKRAIAWLLCFCMFATLLSTTAFAGPIVEIGEQQCRVNIGYDWNRGSIFYAIGEEPEAYLGENDVYVEKDETIRFRIDETIRKDWRASEQEGEDVFTEADFAEDRALYVVCNYKNKFGYWKEATLIAGGEAQVAGLAFTFENNELSLTVQDEMNLRFYWTKGEYDFDAFSQTEDYPVIVEYNCNGRGEVNVPEGIADDEYFQYENRVRLRVREDVEELVFTWDPAYTMRHIRVNRIEAEGGDLEIDDPEGGEYTLTLDLKWDNGDPRTHYNLNFDFEDGPEANGEFEIYYDQGRGAVYYGLSEAPAADVANYAEPGWENKKSFLTGDEQDPYAPIYLRFDTEHALDWDVYNETGEIALLERYPDPNESLFVSARFEKADQSLFEGLLVAGGKRCDV